MSIGCRCSIHLAPYFSESGIVELIQAYAAEFPLPMDVIIYLLRYAPQCQKTFGFCFRYDVRNSKLSFSTAIGSTTLCNVDPYGIVHVLDGESLRKYVHEFIETRFKNKTVHAKFDAYLEMMLNELREFLTPRCKH